jgi:hypothetical protein
MILEQANRTTPEVADYDDDNENPFLTPYVSVSLRAWRYYYEESLFTYLFVYSFIYYLLICSRIWLSSGMLDRVVWLKFSDVSEVPAASEMSVNYQTTRRNIPEDSPFHTCRRESLKSHLYIYIWFV